MRKLLGIQKKKLLITFCFLFCSGILISSARPQETKKPLAVEDIERLSREELSPEGMARLIREFGIGFEMTDETRARLRRAGTKPETIRILNNMRPTTAGKGLEEQKSRPDTEHKLRAEVAPRATGPPPPTMPPPVPHPILVPPSKAETPGGAGAEPGSLNRKGQEPPPIERIPPNPIEIERLINSRLVTLGLPGVRARVDSLNNVMLEGEVSDPAEKEIAKQAALAVEGVKTVTDRMVDVRQMEKNLKDAFKEGKRLDRKIR